MPVMKTDHERGTFGTWARDARLSAGYQSAEAAVAVLAEQGVKLSAATIRSIEAGRSRPGYTTLRTLEELYDSPAPPPDELVPSDSLILAALNRIDARLAYLVELLEAGPQQRTNGKHP